MSSFRLVAHNLTIFQIRGWRTVREIKEAFTVAEVEKRATLHFFRFGDGGRTHRDSHGGDGKKALIDLTLFQIRGYSQGDIEEAFIVAEIQVRLAAVVQHEPAPNQRRYKHGVTGEMPLDPPSQTRGKT